MAAIGRNRREKRAEKMNRNTIGRIHRDRVHRKHKSGQNAYSRISAAGESYLKNDDNGTNEKDSCKKQNERREKSYYQLSLSVFTAPLVNTVPFLHT